MNDADKRFHEQWIGMAQPSEGLVVSVPVLVDAQCAQKLSREAHLAFLDCLERDVSGAARVVSLAQLLEHVLELGPDRFDGEGALPKELSLYVVEGKQLLQPTRALRWAKPPVSAVTAADSTPAALAGRGYAMLVWEVPSQVRQLDKPEVVTGAWDYPAQAKFERLLRECRVPIGLLSNGYEMRLVYAPHGESSGWLSFRVNDMASVSGRPLFDAFVMLLSRERWFGVAPEQQLPAILAESRKRNADVTNELSRQVFEALEILLAGFSAADERDGTGALRAALEREDEHLYAGLLTVLLRLVFLLYCEDRGLLPTEHPLFAANYSLLGLFQSLQADYGKYPDTMHRRFGAYPQLVALFRAVFLGVTHQDLVIPARRGQLFDPNVYPFLEGWGPGGSAPINQPEDRAAVKIPSVDDSTMYSVLEKLLYLGGQRLSYKALDVEQIGSVYEALMGFAVKRIESGAVRIKLGSKKGAARVWVEAETLLGIAANQRDKWLQDELGFDKNVAAKIVESTKSTNNTKEALLALEPLSGRTAERAAAGTLVIQPGPERRRTSSHYTPRELTEPIVARTLEPLIKAMGDNPGSEDLLRLVICDPAVGSGAFLVAACRYLADHVVAAWTREGRLEVIASTHDDVVNHARRLVAQRCLYGVDKNKYAVQLARLSLWLVTMARNEPFTFVDHAIRHGDSLVGLNFDQIKSFHWKPKAQVETCARLLSDALNEAVDIRKHILDLADEGTYVAQREKERLLLDAEDALERVRLIGDLIVGAFFGQKTDKEREKERNRRLDLVVSWLEAEEQGDEPTADKILVQLHQMQDELKQTQVPFHWMVEFPEVFYAERPDPLDGGKVNGAAMVDAFVGNPPFAGNDSVVAACGPVYPEWLRSEFSGDTGIRGNCDLCAFFFRRTVDLLGKVGSLGLIATNTISQGDSRKIGLKHVLNAGGSIFNAVNSMQWPGDAAVTVSIVHLSIGSISKNIPLKVLDKFLVRSINSRLRAGNERADPTRLAQCSGIACQGSILLGQGFVITPEERDRLISHNGSNAERIFPFIGGEEVNSNPLQSFDRYVISFGGMALQQAETWTDLIEIVRMRVKPDRDRQHGNNSTSIHRKQYWWQFDGIRPELYAAIAPLSRCLVTARVTKHLCFSYQPTDRILNEKLYVFPFDKYTQFAILQSRTHIPWTWLLSSTMKTDLNYSASDCFETFPFPKPDPRTVIPELESIGEQLYEARAKHMVDTNQGLTKTYNAIKDPNNTDPRIIELRELHEEMDRAVLRAYSEGDPAGRWEELVVPPYCPTNDEEKAQVKRFEDEVIDRLFALNALRAAEEKAEADRIAAAKPAKAATSRKKKNAAAEQQELPVQSPLPMVAGLYNHEDGLLGRIGTVLNVPAREEMAAKLGVSWSLLSAMAEYPKLIPQGAANKLAGLLASAAGVDLDSVSKVANDIAPARKAAKTAGIGRAPRAPKDWAALVKKYGSEGEREEWLELSSNGAKKRQRWFKAKLYINAQVC